MARSRLFVANCCCGVVAWGRVLEGGAAPRGFPVVLVGSRRCPFPWEDAGWPASRALNTIRILNTMSRVWLETNPVMLREPITSAWRGALRRPRAREARGTMAPARAPRHAATTPALAFRHRLPGQSVPDRSSNVRGATSNQSPIDSDVLWSSAFQSPSGSLSRSVVLSIQACGRSPRPSRCCSTAAKRRRWHHHVHLEARVAWRG